MTGLQYFRRKILIFFSVNLTLTLTLTLKDIIFLTFFLAKNKLNIISKTYVKTGDAIFLLLEESVFKTTHPVKKWDLRLIKKFQRRISQKRKILPLQFFYMFWVIPQIILWQKIVEFEGDTHRQIQGQSQGHGFLPWKWLKRASQSTKLALSFNFLSNDTLFESVGWMSHEL